MRPESRIASSPYCPSATRAKTSPSREHHAEPEQVSEAKVANRETLSSRSPTTRSILFNRHAKSQLTWEERRVSSPLGWVSFQRNRPDPSTTRLGALRSGFRQKAPARLMPRSRLLSASSYFRVYRVYPIVSARRIEKNAFHLAIEYPASAG